AHWELLPAVALALPLVSVAVPRVHKPTVAVEHLKARHVEAAQVERLVQTVAVGGDPLGDHAVLQLGNLLAHSGAAARRREGDLHLVEPAGQHLKRKAGLTNKLTAVMVPDHRNIGARVVTPNSREDQRNRRTSADLEGAGRCAKSSHWCRRCRQSHWACSKTTCGYITFYSYPNGLWRINIGIWRY